MKSTIFTQIAGAALFAVLAMTAQMIAQKSNATNEKQFPHYRVKDLGTLGGTFSQALGINNKGHVAGAATLSNGTTHAFLWTKRTGMKDLGTLGGPNSAGHRLNDRDEVPVASDTSTPDPLGEDFCAFGTHLICLGSVWKNGVITRLPTLGGNNAEVHTANNRGQVAGTAENATHDPSCELANPSQVLDYEAVRWEPNGEIHELWPLQGDSVGIAYSINGRGQVVGSSGTCASIPFFPVALGPHAVLWESDRSPTDLGSLGGQKVNTATGINDRGEVAGVSNLPGDTTMHTFLWAKERGIQDLGTVGTDVSSTAAAKKPINNKGQVVGASCSTANPFVGLFSGKCRAYLWQDNVMKDLNALIPAESNPDQLQLFLAFGINDAGEIAGWAVEKSTGDIHAFLATPCHVHGDGRECCEDHDRWHRQSGNSVNRTGDQPPTGRASRSIRVPCTQTECMRKFVSN